MVEYSSPAWQTDFMKVLIDHQSPFLLAHGGLQVQIEQTKAALEKAGVEVEYLRWWDETQTGDIIHFFGSPPIGYQNMARRKHIPLVNTVLFTETCNRSGGRLKLQGLVTRAILALPFGGSVKNQLAWKSFQNSQWIIVGLSAEKEVLQTVYGVPESRIRVIPLGCEGEFMAATPATRLGDHLICVATIAERKRILELAQFAMKAEVPILFVGKPYNESDSYWVRFKRMTETSPFIRHKPHVGNRAELIVLLQQARGFALFSKYENWCMVADEASACGLPLLLPDQKWVRERYGSAVHYLSESDPGKNPERLRRFYQNAPNLPVPPRPLPWEEVARRLLEIYRSILNSRIPGSSSTSLP